MPYARRRIALGVFAIALATGATAAPAPPAESQPASSAPTQSSFDQQRFNDLIALIEGQNSPHARRTGARELLRQGWPETVPRLVAIFSGPNRPAKVAVALGLSELPERRAPEYVEPLLAMLGEPDPEVQRAAALALAGNPEDDVLPRLKAVLLDAAQPRATRLAALTALGLTPRREALAVLVEALADRDSPVAVPALAAVERAAGQDFQGSFEAALAWWAAVRDMPLTEWQRRQIEQLVCQSRALEQRVEDLEQRLANALRDNYLRTSEAERAALLNAYLTDPSSAVRRLGLKLAQAQLADGKALTSETIARARELLPAPEPGVRAAAVRTVATLRDPADAERFEQLLAAERHGEVREALVNGLGYVGSATAAAPLLRLLETTDRPCANEAVTALGRLAERGVLDEPTRGTVASALLARMEATPPGEHALRERLLWAMSRVGDPRFGAKFVKALDTPEAASVRLAAVRGIAVMADPRTIKANGQTTQPVATTSATTTAALLSQQELLDALVPVTSDPDAGVRRAAVEVLAQFGASDAHVEALWSRLSPEREPEEGLRVTAWRAAVQVLASRSLDEIQSWLERLPGDEVSKQQYAVELLQAAEKSREARPEARGELGRVRVRIAELRAALGQFEEAISAYLTALEDLRAAESPEITPVAIELLRLALLNDCYDTRLAAALDQGNPVLDGQTLWEGVRGEIEKRLQPDEVDRAIAILVALQTSPPASMPADTQQAIEQLLQRARAIQAETDANSVKAALAKLRENPEDEGARQAITGLELRAVPALRDALRAALQAEQPDASQIQRLHDLLKELLPDWPGFAPEATIEEKLEVLEAIAGE